MIYQWLHSFDKARGVWKLGMNVERSFIDPARVDVKQARISRATKNLYGQAARFRARRGEHVTHHVCDGIFLAVASMEASEDEKLHRKFKSINKINGASAGASGDIFPAD
jgi:hypothetical protein